jgi:hypothetical protein
VGSFFALDVSWPILGSDRYYKCLAIPKETVSALCVVVDGVPRFVEDAVVGGVAFEIGQVSVCRLWRGPIPPSSVTVIRFREDETPPTSIATVSTLPSQVPPVATQQIIWPVPAELPRDPSAVDRNRDPMDDFALRIHRLIAKADGDDEGIPLDEDEDADAIGDLEHQLGGVLKRLKRAGAKKKGKLSKKRLKKRGRKRKLAAVGGAEDFHADPGASGSGALPGALPLPLPSDPLPTLGEPMIEPPLAPLDDDVAEADPPEHLPMFVKGGYTYAPY